MSRIPTPALESATGADIDSSAAESALVNRHAKRSPSRVLLRIVSQLICHAFIISFYLVLSGGIAFAGPLTRHKLPMQPIVNGHHVQPRGDRLQALGYPDLTPQQAEEVDRLYQQLLQNGADATVTPTEG